MLLLDTNVLSEMTRPQPERLVMDWLLRQPSDTLYTAAPCLAEMLSGLAIMPRGQRRAALQEAVTAMFDEDFADRVLPFDASAARAYAAVFERRRSAGRPSGTIDLMLAAIARVHGAGIVTRNVSDFGDVGLLVVNPWKAGPAL